MTWFTLKALPKPFDLCWAATQKTTILKKPHTMFGQISRCADGFTRGKTGFFAAHESRACAAVGWGKNGHPVKYRGFSKARRSRMGETRAVAVGSCTPLGTHPSPTVAGASTSVLHAKKPPSTLWGMLGRSTSAHKVPHWEGILKCSNTTTTQDEARVSCHD